jgi:hypothetical protein
MTTDLPFRLWREYFESFAVELAQWRFIMAAR